MSLNSAYHNFCDELVACLSSHPELAVGHVKTTLKFKIKQSLV